VETSWLVGRGTVAMTGEHTTGALELGDDLGWATGMNDPLGHHLGAARGDTPGAEEPAPDSTSDHNLVARPERLGRSTGHDHDGNTLGGTIGMSDGDLISHDLVARGKRPRLRIARQSAEHDGQVHSGGVLAGGCRHDFLLGPDTPGTRSAHERTWSSGEVVFIVVRGCDGLP
jgi:hypothetical protein